MVLATNRILKNIIEKAAASCTGCGHSLTRETAKHHFEEGGCPAVIVACGRKHRGCHWTGPRAEYELHQESCKFMDHAAAKEMQRLLYEHDPDRDAKIEDAKGGLRHYAEFLETNADFYGADATRYPPPLPSRLIDVQREFFYPPPSPVELCTELFYGHGIDMLLKNEAEEFSAVAHRVAAVVHKIECARNGAAARFRASLDFVSPDVLRFLLDEVRGGKHPFLQWESCYLKRLRAALVSIPLGQMFSYSRVVNYSPRNKYLSAFSHFVVDACWANHDNLASGKRGSWGYKFVFPVHLREKMSEREFERWGARERFSESLSETSRFCVSEFQKRLSDLLRKPRLVNELLFETWEVSGAVGAGPRFTSAKAGRPPTDKFYFKTAYLCGCSYLGISSSVETLRTALEAVLEDYVYEMTRRAAFSAEGRQEVQLRNLQAPPPSADIPPLHLYLPSAALERSLLETGKKVFGYADEENKLIDFVYRRELVSGEICAKEFSYMDVRAADNLQFWGNWSVDRFVVSADFANNVEEEQKRWEEHQIHENLRELESGALELFEEYLDVSTSENECHHGDQFVRSHNHRRRVSEFASPARTSPEAKRRRQSS
eukprot:CAMPEP_0178993388 /NCGR_PEP_ID=MMETSP0795-20121207/6675_1 /TAXON_ID=88552 /ORGANISM="Amoebophrya sp., Strain Ameob2" /LENGTH=602 /DNA_ID=CAMNT_0020685441 /DNA_START=1120 /DNA_END=2929 /DNA_ORIENTATION=+